jgi:hypothetical protein
MIGKKSAVVAIGTALLLAASMSQVHAQACLGVPTGDGSFTPQFTIGLQDQATTFGGLLTANFPGPLSLQGAYAMADYDLRSENDNTFGAQAAFEIPGLQFSACPFVGGGYTKGSISVQGADFDENTIVIPIGFGMGKRLATGSNTSVTFFGTPRFLYVRTETDLLTGGNQVSATSDDTRFATDLGVRFGLGSAFLGGAVSLDSDNDSDTIVLFTIGFGFGGR